MSADLLDILCIAVRCADVDQQQLASALDSFPPDITRSAINRVLDDGSTPLNVALANRRFDVARALLGRGCDVNLPDSFRLDGCRRKPVHYACAVGCLDLVRTFIEELGVNVDDEDEGRSTPLHHAAAAGHIDVVEYLVSADCDVNAVSNSGRTALWKAAQAGHREIVQLLYVLGARVDLPNRVGETVLFECSRRPALVGVLADLLQFGADPRATDVEGSSALHVAAAAGNYLAAEQLIAAGVDVNATNEYGNSALHNAVVHGQGPMVVFLLNVGVDGAQTNRSGQSPLYIALLHQRVACMYVLLDAGYRLSPDEMNVFETLEADRSPAKRTLLDGLQKLSGNAASLTQICRTIIRRHLMTSVRTKNLLQTARHLPLPERLQMFLLLDEHT